MMRKPFIAANWKMNKLVEESVDIRVPAPDIT